jgi:hypothetical protein
MADVLLLRPHANMSVEECLAYCRTEQEDYKDVMVVAYDVDGALIVRSSRMDRKDALWMLTAAVDHARGRD